MERRFNQAGQHPIESQAAAGKDGVELPGFERLVDAELGRHTGGVDLFVNGDNGNMEYHC